MQIISMGRRALDEDIGVGGVTTTLTSPSGLRLASEIVAREDDVVAGLEVTRQVFGLVDGGEKLRLRAAVGNRVAAGRHHLPAGDEIQQLVARNPLWYDMANQREEVVQCW